MSAEVTAVITTHVRPLRVCDALESLRAETHRDVEIVVVDDGGSCDFGNDVRIIRGHDLGIGRARNLGLDAARGEFIIFLDDDDVALPHRIARLVATARRTRADLCFGLTRRVIAGTSAELPAVPTNITSSGVVTFNDLLACNPHVNAVLARTASLRAAGGFDADASHFDDWSAWLRMSDRGGVVVAIDDVVAEWRIHTNGLSEKIVIAHAMKRRLLALFERLRPALSEPNARAVAAARRAVITNEIVTYDDYVRVIAQMRENRSHTASLTQGSLARI